VRISFQTCVRTVLTHVARSYLGHGEFGIYVEVLIDKIIEVLGTVDPGHDEAVPAYEPPADQNQMQNQAIIEKAKGMARDLGATSS
jgi:hypothetical protein